MWKDPAPVCLMEVTQCKCKATRKKDQMERHARKMSLTAMKVKTMSRVIVARNFFDQVVLCNLYLSYYRNFMRYLYACKFQAGFITTFEVKDWKNLIYKIGDIHGDCNQQLSS